MTVKDKILQGRTYLGIELGSTRIKAVLIDDSFSVIASGSKQWENRFENGCWTYSLDDIHGGIQACYKGLAENVKAQCAFQNMAQYHDSSGGRRAYKTTGFQYPTALEHRTSLSGGA